MTEQIPGVGAVVFDAAGRLLVVQRAKDPARGRWSIPGGHVESGESHESAVVREVLEETGLQVRVLNEVGHVVRPAPGGGEFLIRDFRCELVGDGEPRAGDDAADARFVTVGELMALPVAPGLLEALQEWRLIPSRCRPTRLP